MFFASTDLVGSSAHVQPLIGYQRKPKMSFPKINKIEAIWVYSNFIAHVMYIHSISVYTYTLILLHSISEHYSGTIVWD